MRALLAAILCTFAIQSEAACRQALALGLDVSGSVDTREYRMQLDGLATALTSSAVTQALIGDSAAPVRILVYEWSGADDPTLILPWTEMADANAILDAATILRAHNRGPKSPTTALGAALETGFSYLDQQLTCWTHTLDISGDGPSNTGPRPQDVDRPSNTIVNGLVIGADDPNASDQRQSDIKELSSYFAAYVISGPGAFVETASGFAHYADAMERKLLRELQVIAIGQLQTSTP